MLLMNARPLKAREQGMSFDGITNPTTGKTHFAQVLPEKDRIYALEALSIKATARRYIVKAPLTVAEDGLFLPNTITELSSFLGKVAATMPKGTKNRLQYFERFFFDEEGIEKTGRCLLPRIVVIPEFDRYKVHREFWDKFLFVMAERKEDIYPAITKRMETSVESILENARLNARFIANIRKTKTLAVYEEILDNAFRDSGLELHAFVSMAPSAVHALMLRTYMYLFLAKPNLNPDFVVEAIHGLERTAPHNYHPENEKFCFKTKEKDKKDGFSQLLYEAALTAMEITSRPKNGIKTFRDCQKEVEMVQFTEDIALLVRHFNAFAEELMSEGGATAAARKQAN